MDNNVSRRCFLQVAGITAAGAAIGLVGCGKSRSEDDASASVSSSSNAPTATGSTDETSAAEAGSESSTSQEATSQDPTREGKSLVLVFSRADENYGVGTVEVGNTMVLAQMIAEKTGADLFEIERSTAYPASYDACCDEALEEQRADARPELKAMPDIADYDTVYFGFPCWWGDLPMPVYTAIEALDWSGKTISPFNTHAGSGESGMFSTLADKCTGATVTSGLTLSGETAQNNRVEAAAGVDSWLSSLD
ncbi:MAG: flavodoxin [Atopobiaceae bacterium]|nr:flavodoxin [Atopobiaceae bacterium]